MADTAIAITAGSGTNIDTRTEATNGNHRQVIVVGDPATNAGVAPVDATAGLKVDLGTDNDVTVTGTVDLGATDNAVLDSIVTNTTNLQNALVQDDAPFTPATGYLMMIGGEYDDAGTDSVDEGDAGNVRITANRSMHTTLRDAAGNERGANVDASNRLTVVADLNAGTNAIGKLAANSGVDIGDVDVTSLPALPAGTNAIGQLNPPDIDVTAHTNYAKKYYTSTGAATDGIIWSPAAGKRWHVVSMYIQTSAAATITLEDDKAGGDEAIWKGEFTDNQGMTINFGEKYPLASGEDAADLTVTTSAGNIYITVTGYEV